MLDSLGSVILISLFWLVSLGLVVTAGAGTVVAYEVCRRYVLGKDAGLWAVATKALRQSWKQATVIGLLALPVAALAILTISYLPTLGLADVVVADLHAEATSEKQALARYLDGKVAAVVGTHTHVQTADERVLAGGTATITDLGLTGGLDGVIGMKTEISITRQRLQARGERMQPADGELHLQGAVVDVNTETGLARSIERVSVPYAAVLEGAFGRAG